MAMHCECSIHNPLFNLGALEGWLSKDYSTGKKNSSKEIHLVTHAAVS